MKCKHCNSEWHTANELKTCPFCGKYLADPEPFEDIELALAFIMDAYGEQVSKNPRCIVAFLSDLAPKLTNERRLLKVCADAGIIAELLSITEQTEMALAAKRSVLLLNGSYFLEREWAEKAVGWIATSLGRPVQLRQLQPKKSNGGKVVLIPEQGTSNSTVEKKLMEASKSTHADDEEEKRRLAYELCKLLHWYLGSTRLSSSGSGLQAEKTQNHNKRITPPDGKVIFVVKNSLNPLSLANGCTYKFKIDDALEIPVVAEKKEVSIAVDLLAGPHTVGLKIYGWEDPQCSGKVIHDVRTQTFKIEPHKATFIIAKRPGLFTKMTLDIVNANQESYLAK